MNTFSPEELYAIKAQGYWNQWDNILANAYWDIANNLWRYSTYANNTLGTYDNLLNYMAGNEQQLQWTAGNLYWNLVNDINTQRDYVYNTFWPDGTLTKEVNAYYDDLWNYLATDAWRQAATIAAQGTHSGASLGSIRAQQNEAYNESFQRYIQAKEQQINAKQQIAANLINFMSTLRQEYWNTTNQYIIELYKRANDLYKDVATSAASDLNQYNQLLATPAWWGGWSSSASGTQLLPRWLVSNWDWTYSDSQWNRYDSNWNIIGKSESKTKWVITSEVSRTGEETPATTNNNNINNKLNNANSLNIWRLINKISLSNPFYEPVNNLLNRK